MCDLWTLDNWKGHKQPYLCLMPKAMCICEFAKMPTQANKVGHITFPTADKGCFICSSHKFKVDSKAFLNQQIQNFLIAFTIVLCEWNKGQY